MTDKKNYLENVDFINMNQNMLDHIMKQAKQMMWSMVEYKEMQMLYNCAMKEIKTKLEILSTEFNIKHKRNPISSINSRLKRNESIIRKLTKLNVPFTIKSIEENLNDVAGIRVVCSYIDDIYTIAEALLKQDDIKLIIKKDYIKNPKPNGYRSLHLIISVPVFLENSKKEVKVEVQIRTIAMDFWSSLEHQIKYKKSIPNPDELGKQLLECADVINKTDEKMLTLRKEIEAIENKEDSDEILFQRLSNLDMPF